MRAWWRGAAGAAALLAGAAPRAAPAIRLPRGFPAIRLPGGFPGRPGHGRPRRC